MAISDMISKIVRHPLTQDIGIPLLGTAIDAGINFGMMNYQNKFNAREAQIAREWNRDMDSTKYQRTVTDMKAAGVNPALAMDGGVTTQAGSNATAQGATPAYMNLSSMANMVQALSQARLNNAEAKNVDTDTEKKQREADYYATLNDKEIELIESIRIDNKYKDEYWQLNIKGKKLANDMTDAEISQIHQNIEKMKSEIKLNEAKVNTEEEKVKLMITEEALNNANSYRIKQLVPFEQEYMSAQTEDAKASAKLKAAQAAWQEGLIDEGAIEATVRKLNAEASEAEIKAIMDETRHQLGIEKAEVANKRADTITKYVEAGAKAVAVLADVTLDIVGAVGSGGATLGIPSRGNPIGFR